MPPQDQSQQAPVVEEGGGDEEDQQVQVLEEEGGDVGDVDNLPELHLDTIDRLVA